MFFVSYGIMFTIAPMIFGVFFTAVQPVVNATGNQSWIDTYNKEEGIVKWLIPLIPTIGIFVAIIKIFMVASSKGRD